MKRFDTILLMHLNGLCLIFHQTDGLYVITFSHTTSTKNEPIVVAGWQESDKMLNV